MQASSSKLDTNFLSTYLQGTGWLIESRYQFYFSSKLSREVANWNPWFPSFQIPRDVIAGIDDEKLKQLFEALNKQYKELDNVNQEGAEAFSAFLKQPLPSTVEGLYPMAMAVNKIRKKKGAFGSNKKAFNRS